MRRNLINPRCLIVVLVPLVGLLVIVQYVTVINTDAVLNKERKLYADIDKETMEKIEESSPDYAKDDTIGNLRKSNLELDGSGGTGAVGTTGATVVKKENGTITSEEQLARLKRLQQEVMELENALRATQPQENGTGSSAPLVKIIQNLKKLLEEANSQMQNGIIDEPHRTKTAEPESTGTMQHLLRLGEAFGSSTAASPGISTSANTSTTSTSIAITNTSSDGEEEPGFAACLNIMDDTLRLYEWLSYHYTVLPLTSVVFGVDPKSTNDSVTEIHNIAERWSRFGLNITIWPLVENPGNMDHRLMQLPFVQNCTQHFLDKKREKWLLLTDSDEFLSYNYFVPGAENINHFPRKGSIFMGPTAPSKEKRASDRRAALPIRKILPDSHRSGATILSFIEAQQANSSQDYFPAKNGCTRIVGLTYGIKTTNATQDDLLVTRKYQYHKKPIDHLSKLFLDLSKMEPWHLELGQLQHGKTVHNPFPLMCGKNGRADTGQDFMGSVLRINHYVGTLESWLERGGGNGTREGKQNEAAWRKKDSRAPKYDGPPDVRAGDWVDSFVTRVGSQAAKELLFTPLAERTAFIRSMLHL